MASLRCEMVEVEVSKRIMGGSYESGGAGYGGEMIMYSTHHPFPIDVINRARITLSLPNIPYITRGEKCRHNVFLEHI